MPANSEARAYVHHRRAVGWSYRCHPSTKASASTTRSAVPSLARAGITVNVICPGAIETQIDDNTNRRNIDKVKLDVEKEALPGGFNARLSRALLHYGVHDLEPVLRESRDSHREYVSSAEADCEVTINVPAPPAFAK